MRILMIAPTPYFSDRGCHVRIYEEARVLVGRGHEVRVAAYHLGRDMPGVPTVRTCNVPWYRKLTAGPSWHKPYLDILLFFRALKEIRRFRPHLIHAHLHEGALIGIFLKAVTRIPFLFDCQGSLTTEIADHGFLRSGSLPLRVFGVIERWINTEASFIITSSTAGEHELRTRWDVGADRVHALIDGVDTSVFHPGNGEEVRRELGLPTTMPVVAYLGVLSSYQGVDLLLEAAVGLRDRGILCHFLIMGYPDEQYRRKAAAMKLDDRITFTGRVDYADAPKLLAAADMAVSAKISLTEANGKLFNYMACGLATVAFDTPVNREILEDAAAYASFGDGEDLSRRIEELVVDAEQRQSLGKKARDRAVAVHSWEKRGEELERIYQLLLQRGPAECS